MKRFAEALTTGQREQICEKNVVLWKKMQCSEKHNQESYTGKTSRHVACGYAYKVWSDGEVSDTKFYRSEGADEVFEGDFAIREDLRTVVLLVMGGKDWIDFNKATHCHICKKSLVKESFLDPFSFCERDGGSYCGKAHKKNVITRKNSLGQEKSLNRWMKQTNI